jgi:hypothetical protein
MKVIMPDYSDPIFWIAMILICVYAYMGGKWLDKRNKTHADKLQEEERKKRIKEFKSGKI